MTRLQKEARQNSPISAVDLFCGAGGLTHGLMRARIDVRAGIDIDTNAEHAYTTNNGGARFLRWDVAESEPASISRLFRRGRIRLLAGCAPCQPFSKLTNGAARHGSWGLLDHFGRLVDAVKPELVTMENVPELERRGRAVFDRFRRTLKRHGYFVDWAVINCRDFGAPQSRKRLVLLASRLGQITIPKPTRPHPEQWTTVRDAIAVLPRVEAGGCDPDDVLHVASLLSPLNMTRLRATPSDGGTKESWPAKLALECHRDVRGARYYSIYGRMWWDKPAPTMTTLCNGIGNGRFGHPTQDRAITLREAALLQTFPRDYEFWPKDDELKAKAVARLIGNAVPPLLGEVLGKRLMKHVREFGKR